MSDTDGLREALKLLNKFREVTREDWKGEEPSFFAATNCLLQVISFREGKSINDLVKEMKA